MLSYDLNSNARVLFRPCSAHKFLRDSCCVVTRLLNKCEIIIKKMNFFNLSYSLAIENDSVYKLAHKPTVFYNIFETGMFPVRRLFLLT